MIDYNYYTSDSKIQSLNYSYNTVTLHITYNFLKDYYV